MSYVRQTALGSNKHRHIHTSRTNLGALKLALINLQANTSCFSRLALRHLSPIWVSPIIFRQQQWSSSSTWCHHFIFVLWHISNWKCTYLFSVDESPIPPCCPFLYLAPHLYFSTVFMWTVQQQTHTTTLGRHMETVFYSFAPCCPFFTSVIFSVCLPLFSLSFLSFVSR